MCVMYVGYVCKSCVYGMNVCDVFMYVCYDTVCYTMYVCKRCCLCMLWMYVVYVCTLYMYVSYVCVCTCIMSVLIVLFKYV